MSDQNSQSGKKNNTLTILIILGVIILLCISCSLVGIFGYFWFQRQAEEAAESSSTEIENQFEEFNNIFEEAVEEAEKKQNDQNNNSESENEETDSDSQSSESDAREIAVIEGSLSYPSEGIPSDLYVCAEEVNSNQEYCTYEQITAAKYQYNKGYKIEVPAGTYNVYASTQTDPNYKAYYSEFVTCGLSVDCPSHNPIDVTVGEGETKTAIDPADWYAQ